MLDSLHKTKVSTQVANSYANEIETMQTACSDVRKEKDELAEELAKTKEELVESKKQVRLEQKSRVKTRNKWSALTTDIKDKYLDLLDKKLEVDKKLDECEANHK